MQMLFKILLSPLTFAIGFLWPLLTQSLTSMNLAPAGWPAIIIGAAVAISFGIMAQTRGSWIWIK